MNPPIEGMTKRPAGEEFMVDAFLGFVSWADSKKEVLDEYAKYITLQEGQLNFHDWLVVFMWGEEE